MEEDRNEKEMIHTQRTKSKPAAVNPADISVIALSVNELSILNQKTKTEKLPYTHTYAFSQISLRVCNFLCSLYHHVNECVVLEFKHVCGGEGDFSMFLKVFGRVSCCCECRVWGVVPLNSYTDGKTEKKLLRATGRISS